MPNVAFSLSNALAAASLLDKAMGAKYFAKIGSLVEQADEVDGKYLQVRQWRQLSVSLNFT